MMNLFLAGAIMMGSFVVGLFFLRFYLRTRERLFLIFAAAFGMLALERWVLAFVFVEHTGEVYTVRLLAFVLILVAIIDKNRPKRPKPQGRGKREEGRGPE